MSLDDVAKVTKIQPRILERLEAGKLDGLPAAVFVRGFVRSFARCVGLDEREALRRCAACAIDTQDLTPTVRALVEVMADLAPGSATAARATPRRMQAVEVIDLSAPADAPGAAAAPPPSELAAGAVASPQASAGPAAGDAAAREPRLPAAAAPSKKKRGRRRKARAAAAAAREPSAAGTAREPSAAGMAREPSAAGMAREPSAAGMAREPSAAGMARESSAAGMPREPLAVGTPPGASPVVAPIAAEASPPGPVATGAAEPPAAEQAAPADPPPSGPAAEPAEPAAPWPPKLPPIAATPSVPWRRPAHRLAGAAATSAIGAASTAAAGPVAPSLVIDDADPESAARALEERDETLAPRRSFLPPILLDREDRSARQGGLTLAVILLLIAATLTLSYLMRRPGASGDGMTGREAATHRLG